MFVIIIYGCFFTISFNHNCGPIKGYTYGFYPVEYEVYRYYM